ncbi:MAG: hypothetical protein AB1726_07170, partial [Planctomycetota bacterium]
GPLRAELAGLELAAARDRLRALAATLGTPAARRRAEALAADLELAAAAFESLAAEFAAGGWRRRTISDPRTGRAANREAIGASAEGVLLQGGDPPELVPWSAFGGRAESIEKLFKGRLARAYTPAEHAGILVLLHMGAAVEAAQLADQVLAPGDSSIFQPAEAAAITAAFDRVLAWSAEVPAADRATLAPRLADLARAREAAGLVAEALLASQEEAWNRLVGALELLFRDHRDDLLVSLLSDGTDWEGPPPGGPAPAGGG